MPIIAPTLRQRVVVILVFLDGEFSDAEIEYLYHRRQVGPLLNENVGRLQVTMNQAGVMGLRPPQHTPAELTRPPGPDRAARRALIKSAQGSPLEQLHHDVEIPVFSRAEVSDRHGVRMLHATGGPRFPAEIAAGQFDRQRIFD